MINIFKKILYSLCLEHYFQSIPTLKLQMAKRAGIYRCSSHPPFALYSLHPQALPLKEHI